MPTITGFMHEDDSWTQPQVGCAVVPSAVRVSLTVKFIAQSVIEPAWLDL